MLPVAYVYLCFCSCCTLALLEFGTYFAQVATSFNRFIKIKVELQGSHVTLK